MFSVSFLEKVHHLPHWQMEMFLKAHIFFVRHYLSQPWIHTVKNSGIAQIFAQIARGVDAFQTKLPGGPLFWVLLEFY
jgi:hypothetical protein